MKNVIENALHHALATLVAEAVLPAEVLDTNIQVQRSKNLQHGDFASNIALVLAKTANTNPRQLAQQICDALPTETAIAKVEIAGPGFINFFVAPAVSNAIIERILQQGERFGWSKIGAGKTVLLEFVSANPTGPLHVGHGRGAAYGAALADLLTAAGFAVTREYYVNDAGRQMDILAVSVWCRYLDACGTAMPFPANAYQGDYVVAIAKQLQHEYGQRFVQDSSLINAELPPDEMAGGDKEIYIDALIARAKSLLDDDYRLLFDVGLNCILQDIREDLAEFGLEYQRWFSERQLIDSGQVDECVQRLQDAGYLYRETGALWFKTTAFGDEKDRVVQRENGQMTYFASDIAYHLNKFDRGYDRVINIWGADHHGYIARVKAALRALSGSAERLEILLVQFATLYRGKVKVPMSTRSGSFVTLRELRDEVGRDATRFFYTSRRCEQHMDFDIELAKSQSNDNPVFYIQYAHARIATMFRKAAEKGYTHKVDHSLNNLDQLTTAQEQALIRTLSQYPERLEQAALAAEPHQLIYYLRDLATDFHKYYDMHKILLDEATLRDARLTLSLAAQQVIRNALGLVGVSAPDSM